MTMKMELPFLLHLNLLYKNLIQLVFLLKQLFPEEEPATFEDVYDVYSKKETIDDDDWTKVCNTKKYSKTKLNIT